ncbi:ankyrin repeat-containing protein [Streptococcus cristatus AS 1.3089]|uniref:Ankyrin repeat-containing protein n=1 Tax=Streptococcus cristatus AS 1.3089 TaxID=1302863 RepID=A0ABN4BBQ6_STRCR|nr:ankyrin repeat-containing protein [Streptococcus cristatus AS 1.3089]
MVILLKTRSVGEKIVNILSRNLLLEAGSDYKLKNKSGKSCLDYAEEYSWRSSLLDIIKEYEDGRN